MAASKGFEEVFQVIHNECKGVDWNAVNKYGQTALHIAAREGKDGVVKLLLGFGASNLQDQFGFYPLHEACSFGHLEVWQLDSSNSREKIVKLLAFHGVDLNGRTMSFPESTGLHIAATNGYFDIVQFLVQCHAHILVRDAENNLPKDVASPSHIKEFLEGNRVVRTIE